MDDIAREIGISKKTIYQSYSDKDKLVHAYLEREKAEQITMMEEITKSSKNAVEEILNAMQFMGKTFSRINGISAPTIKWMQICCAKVLMNI